MKTRKLNPFLLILVTALIASPTISQPASDLLEKGIFAEETVGDLDEAIGIYKQILNDAEANRKPAAQAQYRLAMCYLKKGQETQASEAFEQLITKYPEQAELIAEARQHMPGRLVVGPVPWNDGEVLRLDLRLPAGLAIGMFSWNADRIKTEDGVDAWEVKTLRYITARGIQVKSGVVAEADGFRPITSRFDHPMMGDFSATYSPTQVEIINGDENAATEVELHDVVFDNEQAVHLIRRLPLEVGYKTTLPIFVTFTGGKRIDVGMVVEAKEVLKVPAGDFECYRVVLEIENVLRQSLWYSTDSNRHLVKLEADGVIAELAAIEQRGTNERVDFHDEKLGFSLSAPAGWYFYQPVKDDPVETEVHLIDPDATAFFFLDVDTLESAGIDVTRPIRELVEDKLKKMTKRRVGYTVRTDSWVEQTINGRPAISYTADYLEGDKSMVEYRTAILGESVVANLGVRSEADMFEATRPMLDQIVSTFEAK